MRAIGLALAGLVTLSTAAIAEPAERDNPSDKPLITLDNLTWHRGPVLSGDFTLHNVAAFDMSSVLLRCEFFDKSGAQFPSQEVRVTETVRAQSAQAFRNFTLQFGSEVPVIAKVDCRAIGFTR